MREAVIVEALRSPIARGKLGKGALSGIHPAKLLATQSPRYAKKGIHRFSRARTAQYA